MKTKIFIIALLINIKSFAQQQIKFIYSNEDKFSYSVANNDKSLINFSSAILLKIFVPELNKLNKLEFQDETSHSRIVLENLQLISAKSEGIINLTINQFKKVNSFESLGEVPYPFNIIINYNGMPFSSGLIGSNSIVNGNNNSNEMDNSNSNGQKNNSVSVTNIAYYDALAIEQMLKKRQCKLLFDFLDKTDYFNPGTDFNIKNFKNEIDKTNNNFLKDVFSCVDTTFCSGVSPESNFSSFSLPSIGNLDVTTIADGFAKFIVKRTKQELSIAFFEKFQEELKKYPDLICVFPKTYNTLTTMGTEIYLYENYIQTLRESFKNDLASLPANLPGIINNHKKYFDERPELKAELLTAFYMAQAIQNNQHPGEIIENYDVDILDSVQNIKAAFQTLQLFSMSLRSNNNNDTTYWASYSDIKKLAKDETLLKIYLGLVLQKAKSEKIIFILDNKQVLLDSIMNKYYDKTDKNLRPYKTYITNLATRTQALDIKIKGLKKIKNDSLLFEGYYNVASSSIRINEICSSN